VTNVRMGEIAVSAQPDCELVALGLGSCIGLAMVDWEAGIAGLAHIVLPESRGDSRHAGKFADLAVPELLARVRSLGARVPRLKVAIAGGARMFALEGTMDVGSRNEEAVRAALVDAGVTIAAAHTGGRQGRTLRVYAGRGRVTIRSASGKPVVLLAAPAAPDGRPGPSPYPLNMTNAFGVAGGMP
jgi:chemotaxis protein CheD